MKRERTVEEKHEKNKRKYKRDLKEARKTDMQKVIL